MPRTFNIVKGSTEISIINTGTTGWIGLRGELGSASFALDMSEGDRVPEIWRLTLKQTSHDAIAEDVQEFITILREAYQYHNELWQGEPVYIRQQGTNESAARYALVIAAPSLEWPDLFDLPFEVNADLEYLDITILREHPWRSGAPDDIGGAITLGKSDGPDLSLVDRSSNRVVPSTATGGIINASGWIDPVVGNGLGQFGEATENLCENTSFEVDTAGWATGGTNTIARSIEKSKFGDYSLKCTYQDSPTPASYTITITAVPHTCGIWIYIPSDYDGTDLGFGFQGFVGGVTEGYTQADMTLVNQWQFVPFADFTPDGGDLTGLLKLRENGSVPTAGRFFYVDGAQCEAKAYPTPTCIGDMGAGHAFTGAAHASTSTRVVTKLNYDDLGALISGQSKLTIFGWLETIHNSYDGYSRFWFDARGVDTNNRIILTMPTNNGLRLYINGDYRITSIGSTGAIGKKFFCATLDFDSDDYNLYVYEEDGTLDSGNSTDAISPTTFTGVGVCHNYAGDNPPNGFMDEFGVELGIWTPEQVEALYLQGLAGTPYQVTDDTLLYLPFDEPERVHVANFRDDVDITDFKEDDGGAYTDLVAGDRLFPAAVAQNDRLLIGSTDRALKHVVIPRLSVAGVLTTSTLTLSYWSGAAMTALVLGTNYTCYPGPTLKDCLEQADEDIVLNILNPPDNAEEEIDGSTASWLEIKETHAAPDYATNPVSNTLHDIYAQSRPYVEIPAASLLGDSRPTLLWRIRTPAGGDENPRFSNLSRILACTRSSDLDRFTPFLNAGGDDNPSAWTTTQKTDASSIDATEAPGGKVSSIDFSGDSTMQPRVEFSGDDVLDAWAPGEYLAMVRLWQSGGSVGDINVKLRTFIGSTDLYAPQADTPAVALAGEDQGPEVIDLGIITIPFSRVYAADSLDATDLIFQIHAERTTGASTLEIYDLILFPVDEGSVGIDHNADGDTAGSGALRGANVLDVDSGVIDWRAQKYIKVGSNLIPAETWVIMQEPPKFEKLATTTRIYFLMLHYPSGGAFGTGPLIASFGCQISVEFFAHYRYGLLRGAG